jgi:hypothetical protein
MGMATSFARASTLILGLLLSAAQGDHVDAVTGGPDALGETTVLFELDGQLARGRGVSTDILEASGRAYLRALSNAVAASARPTSADGPI